MKVLSRACALTQVRLRGWIIIKLWTKGTIGCFGITSRSLNLSCQSRASWLLAFCAHLPPPMPQPFLRLTSRKQDCFYCNSTVHPPPKDPKLFTCPNCGCLNRYDENGDDMIIDSFYCSPDAIGLRHDFDYRTWLMVSEWVALVWGIRTHCVISPLSIHSDTNANSWSSLYQPMNNSRCSYFLTLDQALSSLLNHYAEYTPSGRAHCYTASRTLMYLFSICKPLSLFRATCA